MRNWWPWARSAWTSCPGWMRTGRSGSTSSRSRWRAVRPARHPACAQIQRPAAQDPARAACGGRRAHAFNGSVQQAQAFIDLGFKLGFGGAVTYDRALKLRELAAALPLDALVLETDAPDIPPHWLYTTAGQRARGQAQGRNTPAELARIADVIAQLRGITPQALAEATGRNARAALRGLPAMA
ncbi:putative deoxyribonuclease TATDN1 [Manis javanica]|nr:putative deoxyribonuclease TATDN1 [Manis javanica]